MSKETSNPNEQPKFDLGTHGAVWEPVIIFAKTIPKNPVTLPLISQFVRSGTSVWANYCEADDATSKKDFKHKICICRKEARETKLWLRMVAAAEPEPNIHRSQRHWSFVLAH